MALDARARRLAVVSFDANFPAATAGELGRGHRASRLGSGDALQVAVLGGLLDSASFERPGDVQRQSVPHLGSKPPFPCCWIRCQKYLNVQLKQRSTFRNVAAARDLLLDTRAPYRRDKEGVSMRTI